MGIILHRDLTMNGKVYKAGESVPWWLVYPFFIFHMGMFGASGFFMAYGSDVELSFLYMHGGIAIVAYLIFYWAIFGPETVKWLLIDSVLGVFGIVAQLGWILAFFDKTLADYSVARHFIPFTYYVLYTFLLHRAILDFGGGTRDEAKRNTINWYYLGFSIIVYSYLVFGVPAI